MLKRNELAYSVTRERKRFPFFVKSGVSSGAVGSGDFQWGHWDFPLTYSFPSHYGPGVGSASKNTKDIS